jgi:hypothetical protein
VQHWFAKWTLQMVHCLADPAALIDDRPDGTSRHDQDEHVEQDAMLSAKTSAGKRQNTAAERQTSSACAGPMTNYILRRLDIPVFRDALLKNNILYRS